MYARVRRACMVEGMSIPGSGAGVRAAPGHGEEDAKVFGASGVLTAASATQA